MAIKTFDALLFQKMFLGATARLNDKKEIINELNVFPVPDGDTGTNMTLTMMSAAKEVAKLENPTMSKLCSTIINGVQLGSRGNSGVILSQLFSGMCKIFRDKEVIDVPVLTAAIGKAQEMAYKAIMKPKEGTILTIARAAFERGQEIAGTTDDIESYAKAVLSYMEEVLAKTPEMLPVLKEAGVVDSGGRGLCEVVRGAVDILCGGELHFTTDVSEKEKVERVDVSNISTADIKFGYCTEFIIKTSREFTEVDEAEVKRYLSSIGDSLVVFSGEGMVKIHVHTNNPGNALQKALGYGELSRIKIENMREEHNERLRAEIEKESAAKNIEPSALERKPVGFISVAAGSGLNSIFADMGVDFIISGGQTMNPSTEDMVNAIRYVNADVVYILPNNKNIILAAEQAAQIVKDSSVYVVPSKTVPQGIAALIAFADEKSPMENLKSMTDAMKSVKTGQITYAIRDTKQDGLEIRQNDIIGLDDDGIRSAGSEINEVAVELLRGMVDDESAVISIYSGDEVSVEAADELASIIEDEFDMVDVEVHEGGQPVYYYILSVE